MKKIISIISALVFLPLIALAINITVPSAPGSGYMLISTSTGAYIAASATSSPLFGFVPYTGATGDVDLGTHNLTVDSSITNTTGSLNLNSPVALSFTGQPGTGGGGSAGATLYLDNSGISSFSSDNVANNSENIVLDTGGFYSSYSNGGSGNSGYITSASGGLSMGGTSGYAGGTYTISASPFTTTFQGVDMSSNPIYSATLNSTGFQMNNAIFDTSGVSATKTFTLPDNSGTIALTSDLSSATSSLSSFFVPYTGATTNVDLNNKALANVATLSVGSTTAPTGGVAYFNGNVGIGTAAPTYMLDINPGSGVSTNLLRISSSTGATENGLYVLNNGNVGIGIANPGSAFVVNGLQNANDIVSRDSTTGGTFFQSINDTYGQIGTKGNYPFAF